MMWSDHKKSKLRHTALRENFAFPGNQHSGRSFPFARVAC